MVRIVSQRGFVFKTVPHFPKQSRVNNLFILETVSFPELFHRQNGFIPISFSKRFRSQKIIIPKTVPIYSFTLASAGPCPFAGTRPPSHAWPRIRESSRGRSSEARSPPATPPGKTKQRKKARRSRRGRPQGSVKGGGGNARLQLRNMSYYCRSYRSTILSALKGFDHVRWGIPYQEQLEYTKILLKPYKRRIDTKHKYSHRDSFAQDDGPTLETTRSTTDHS